VVESIWLLDKVSLKRFERNLAMVTMVPAGEVLLPYKCPRPGSLKEIGILAFPFLCIYIVFLHMPRHCYVPSLQKMHVLFLKDEEVKRELNL